MFLHVCGVPARETSGGEVAKWPVAEVTYYEDLAFEGLTRAQVAACYDQAAAQWQAVAGIKLRRVTDKSAAHIVADDGTIDGPYGVLATSELPYGATAESVMHQVFDCLEPWSVEGVDMLIACMCHELGHALGLEHIPGRSALMDPYIVVGRSVPQGPDIDAMQAVYGPPTVEVPRQADPPTETFERLGAYFLPFLVGPFCDGLVARASAEEAGFEEPGEAERDGIEVSGTLATKCWNQVIEPQLQVLGPVQHAAALRSLAKGIAGAMQTRN